MPTNATDLPITGMLSVFGDNGGTGHRFGDGRPAAIVSGLDLDVFTITAGGGRVRVFRAFLDQPQCRESEDLRDQRRRRRRDRKGSRPEPI